MPAPTEWCSGISKKPREGNCSQTTVFKSVVRRAADEEAPSMCRSASTDNLRVEGRKSQDLCPCWDQPKDSRKTTITSELGAYSTSRECSCWLTRAEKARGRGYLADRDVNDSVALVDP